MNPLIKQFLKYGSLRPEVERELNAKIHYMSKSKGDYFLKQGQVITSLFVIEKGLVRGYYTKKDREINAWFGFENMLLGSVLPLYLNQPSFENIQFLENTSIYYISINDLNELYKKYNEMNTIGRKSAEEYCIILEKRIASFQTQTAEQRYQSLLENHPEALQRISLGQIASYLGITQETLSRIRNK